MQNKIEVFKKLSDRILMYLQNVYYINIQIIAFNPINSFSASLWPANLAPAPANIFKKLCPIRKNDKIRFFVSFLVSFESSFKED